MRFSTPERRTPGARTRATTSEARVAEHFAAVLRLHAPGPDGVVAPQLPSWRLCSANTSYEPVAQASSYEPATCILGVSWTPEKTPERPVVCIDWCDPNAYCKWAGKRLCGQVGGGGLEITGGLDTPGEHANDATKSQWFNACSQGGKTRYAYGDVYDPGTCEGEVSSPDWKSTKKNVGARAGCHGATEPWASIRDLNGSVSEYTDECRIWVSPSSGKGTKMCALRGGSVTDEKDALRCALSGLTSTGTAAPQTGFRCCKDL